MESKREDRRFTSVTEGVQALMADIIPLLPEKHRKVVEPAHKANKPLPRLKGFKEIKFKYKTYHDLLKDATKYSESTICGLYEIVRLALNPKLGLLIDPPWTLGQLAQFAARHPQYSKRIYDYLKAFGDGKVLLPNQTDATIPQWRPFVVDAQSKQCFKCMVACISDLQNSVTDKKITDESQIKIIESANWILWGFTRQMGIYELYGEKKSATPAATVTVQPNRP